MHKYILKDATLEELKDFVDYAIDKIKNTDEDLYNTLEKKLYKEVYGCHFNEWLMKKALAKLVNEDGTTGAHWTLEQTTSVAKQNNISFTYFNEYDWCYVMNMIYSDYFGILNNDLSTYIKMARKFLEDKDAKEGKALCYFLAMTD